MKWLIFLLFQIVYPVSLIFSQDPISQDEELISEMEDAENLHEEAAQLLYRMLKKPLNLNTASRDQLTILGLTISQINALRDHIRLFGPLVSVYELQAISVFTDHHIRRIRPYVFVADPGTINEKVKTYLKEGEHFAIIRAAQTLEKAKGYKENDSGIRQYHGSPKKLLVRYQYRSAKNLSIGFTGKKDAGEEWFKGHRKDGFDFYSSHIFYQDEKKPYKVALGDYSIQLGQGLIQWQGFSAGKSVGPVGINRQNKELRPYSGSGEFNFYRGIGFSTIKKKWNLTTFISFRKLNATRDTDTTNRTTVSSLLTSGLNRTGAEISRRKFLRHFAYGGSLRYIGKSGHISANFVTHRFSHSFSQGKEPHSFFDFFGRAISNASVDYAFSFQNLYAFGELATDRQKDISMLNGIIVSPDKMVDLVILHRKYNRGYHSLFASSFGQQATPQNESGLFLGTIVRLSRSFQLELYADMVRFPWLKFHLDAPGFQKEYSVTIRYNPSKRVEFYSRMKMESKNENDTGYSPFKKIAVIRKFSWRSHIGYKILPDLAIRQRFEMTRVKSQPAEGGAGFLFYTEVIYDPPLKNFDLRGRIQFFEVSDYSSRIYAYEPDVLFNSSTPVFDGRGWRYLMVVHKKFRTKVKKFTEASIDAYVKWSQSLYPGSESIGSGWEEITGSKKSELKLQLILSFD